MTRLPLSPLALSTVAAYSEEDWTTDAPDIEAVCRAYRAGGGSALLVAPSDVEAVARGLVDLANTEDEVAEGRNRSPDAVLPTIPTAADLAAMLGTPGDLDGVVVYSDPPYVGTTGYAADLPRADVVRFALDCAALGAVVCVSEAEVLSELPGWHAVEITAGRKGQKRTFSKQQGEWLTMNREPAHRVATQPGLFTLGGAA